MVIWWNAGTLGGQSHVRPYMYMWRVVNWEEWALGDTSQATTSPKGSYCTTGDTLPQPGLRTACSKLFDLFYYSDPKQLSRSLWLENVDCYVHDYSLVMGTTKQTVLQYWLSYSLFCNQIWIYRGFLSFRCFSSWHGTTVQVCRNFATAECKAFHIRNALGFVAITYLTWPTTSCYTLQLWA